METGTIGTTPSSVDRVEANQRQRQERGYYRIAFIEDNPDIIDQLETEFQPRTDVFVLTYLNPLRALIDFDRRHYDVDAIITDIAMPQKNGRALTEEIREQEHVRGKKKPVELFWYTGWPIDLDDRLSSFAQTFHEAGVRKLYVKGDQDGPSTPVQVVNDVVEYLNSIKDTSNADKTAQETTGPEPDRQA